MVKMISQRIAQERTSRTCCFRIFPRRFLSCVRSWKARRLPKNGLGLVERDLFRVLSEGGFFRNSISQISTKAMEPTSRVAPRSVLYLCFLSLALSLSQVTPSPGDRSYPIHYYAFCPAKHTRQAFHERSRPFEALFGC